MAYFITHLSKVSDTLRNQVYKIGYFPGLFFYSSAVPVAYLPVAQCNDKMTTTRWGLLLYLFTLPDALIYVFL